MDENCPGPIVKKDKANDRISKLMDKIRPERETRKKPSLSFVQSNYLCLLNYILVKTFILYIFFFIAEKSKRQFEDSSDTVGALPEKELGT